MDLDDILPVENGQVQVEFVLSEIDEVLQRLGRLGEHRGRREDKAGRSHAGDPWDYAAHD